MYFAVEEKKKSYSHNSIIIPLNFHKGKVPNLETLKQTSFLKTDSKTTGGTILEKLELCPW